MSRWLVGLKRFHDSDVPFNLFHSRTSVPSQVDLCGAGLAKRQDLLAALEDEK